MERFADETDRLESRHPQVDVISVSKSKEDAEDIHPLAIGENLGRNSANLGVGGREGHERVLLDLALRVIVKGKPAVGIVGLSREFLEKGEINVARAGGGRRDDVLVLIECSSTRDRLHSEHGQEMPR